MDPASLCSLLQATLDVHWNRIPVCDSPSPREGELYTGTLLCHTVAVKDGSLQRTVALWMPALVCCCG